MHTTQRQLSEREYSVSVVTPTCSRTCPVSSWCTVRVQLAVGQDPQRFGQHCFYGCVAAERCFRYVSSQQKKISPTEERLDQAWQLSAGTKRSTISSFEHSLVLSKNRTISSTNWESQHYFFETPKKRGTLKTLHPNFTSTKLVALVSTALQTSLAKESFKDQRWAWETSVRAEKRDRNAEFFLSLCISISLLRPYTFFSRSPLVFKTLFENACELQRVVLHLEELSQSNVVWFTWEETCADILPMTDCFCFLWM